MQKSWRKTNKLVLGMDEFDYNSGTEQAEAGRPWIQGQLVYIARFCLRNKKHISSIIHIIKLASLKGWEEFGNGMTGDDWESYILDSFLFSLLPGWTEHLSFAMHFHHDVFALELAYKEQDPMKLWAKTNFYFNL